MARRKKVSSDGRSRANHKQGKLSRKDDEKHLAKLHVELVKFPQWVKHEGLKVCVVFEGRGGAGKGGTIKAITERVSPRVFRVIALPAPAEREKSQLYVRRYVSHSRARDEIKLPKRQRPHDYQEPDYPYTIVPEKF